jgi:hypothetical protein
MHIDRYAGMLDRTMTTDSDSTHVGTEHLVQLFDSDESLVEAVSDFLTEGFVLGDTLLAVMDEWRWYSVAMRLTARRLPVDEALQSGQLTVRSAVETLALFMRQDRPERDLFAASVGQLVTGLAAGRGRLRIYGEMVDVLAARGDYAAVHELEALWNELGSRTDFTLFCGYTAAHFGDPRSTGALRRICSSHSEVQTSPRDVLATFLLRGHAAST